VTHAVCPARHARDREHAIHPVVERVSAEQPTTSSNRGQVVGKEGDHGPDVLLTHHASCRSARSHGTPLEDDPSAPCEQWLAGERRSTKALHQELRAAQARFGHRVTGAPCGRNGTWRTPRRPSNYDLSDGAIRTSREERAVRGRDVRSRRWPATRRRTRPPWTPYAEPRSPPCLNRGMSLEAMAACSGLAPHG
jgi:hypothetical protein